MKSACSPVLYVTPVIVGTVVFCGVPLVLHAMRRPDWVKDATVQPAAWANA